MAVIVSRGTTADAPLLYDVLANEMWAEVGRGSICPGKAYDRIHHCLTEGYVFNAWDHGELAGTVGLFEASSWWSEDSYLADSWIFVREKWRRSTVIFKLLRAVKSLPGPVYIGIGSAVDIERKARLFGRFGQMVGIQYKVK